MVIKNSKRSYLAYCRIEEIERDCGIVYYDVSIFNIEFINKIN